MSAADAMAITRKIDRAATDLSDRLMKTFDKMAKDMQGRLDAMNQRHQEEVEANERRHKAQWDVMADYFNRLEERLGVLEDYVKDTLKEFIDSHMMQYHRMYSMDKRHTLRHDASFNTLFRHMQGNEGIFDRWSNRLSRIEAALKLPVGTFVDYNPLRSGEYEQALEAARTAGEDSTDEELWDRLQVVADRFDILKGKCRETMQPRQGETPPPQPGPSRFEGSLRTPSPSRMSVSGGDGLAIDEQPVSPKDGPDDSDEVEFVGGFTESPRKPNDEEEVEFAEAPAGDIVMFDSQAPAGTAPPPTPDGSTGPPVVPATQVDPPVTSAPLGRPAWPEPPAWPDIWPALTADAALTADPAPTAGPALVPPATPAPPASEPPTAPPASTLMTATHPSALPHAPHPSADSPAAPTMPTVPTLSLAPWTESDVPQAPLNDGTTSAPQDAPVVNIIPPTPQNSQPESGVVTTDNQPTLPAAAPTRAAREVESTRVLSEMWGADNSLLPAGPPATRMRGRSRANSAQPAQHSPMIGLRASKSAGAATSRRKSKSPAPTNPPAC